MVSNVLIDISFAINALVYILLGNPTKMEQGFMHDKGKYIALVDVEEVLAEIAVKIVLLSIV